MSLEENFISKNFECWNKLEGYNKLLAQKSITRLSRHQLKEYTELFRTASHHLSYAKTYFEGGKSVEYLNQLLGMSHSYFYTRQKSAFHEIAHYFAAGFPQMFRKYFKFFLVSMALFLAGCVFVIALSYMDSSYMNYFLPEGIAESNNISGSLSDETWSLPILSSVIMTNNIRVCAMAIAFGVLFGAGTVYILLFNGLNIGAVYAMVLVYDMDQLRFWSLILPHGFIELTAIFISGAAGLVIGKHMLIPKDLLRRDSIVLGCKEAFYFLPGLMLMLVIAGLIEGFFTPLNIADELKIVFALVTLLLLLVYLIFAGRFSKSSKTK
ncbi:MAG: stage II sporulation protein M [Clostridiales bacterium]|nr:stage II sporulation protein M [Clostridiales bacterium]